MKNIKTIFIIFILLMYTNVGQTQSVSETFRISVYIPAIPGVNAPKEHENIIKNKTQLKSHPEIIIEEIVFNNEKMLLKTFVIK